jgi:hypothetical protein
MAILENKGYRLIKQKATNGAESYALVNPVYEPSPFGGKPELKSCIIYVLVEEIATKKACRLATLVEKNNHWAIVSSPISNSGVIRILRLDDDPKRPGYGIPALERLCMSIFPILPYGINELNNWFFDITGTRLDDAAMLPRLGITIASTSKNLDPRNGEAGYNQLKKEWVDKYIKIWGSRVSPKFVFETPAYEIVELKSTTGRRSKVLIWNNRLIIRVKEKNTGRTIYLYRSAYGTDGKTKGDWYVTGGPIVSSIDPKDSWLIKGGSKSGPYGCMWRKDLCRLAEEMNKILPKNKEDTDAWLKILVGKTYKELLDHPDYAPPSHKFNGRLSFGNNLIVALDLFKDKYLTPIWGPESR